MKRLPVEQRTLTLPVCFFLVICHALPSTAADSPGIEIFEKRVRPVLVERCVIRIGKQRPVLLMQNIFSDF